MGDRWISAYDAFSRLSRFKQIDAATAICNRAADGLIRARARKFFIGQRECFDTNLPNEFWRSRGVNRLKQNWTTGDFEAWIDATKHCRAHGVTFHESDIEALVPDSLRAEGELCGSAGGRRRSNKWDDWIVELAVFIHEEGLPAGSGVEGQDAIIAAIESRLTARRKEGPSRTTVQPVVRELLRRLRSAGN